MHSFSKIIGWTLYKQQSGKGEGKQYSNETEKSTAPLGVVMHLSQPMIIIAIKIFLNT